MYMLSETVCEIKNENFAVLIKHLSCRLLATLSVFQTRATVAKNVTFCHLASLHCTSTERCKFRSIEIILSGIT